MPYPDIKESKPDELEAWDVLVYVPDIVIASILGLWTLVHYGLGLELWMSVLATFLILGALWCLLFYFWPRPIGERIRARKKRRGA